MTLLRLGNNVHSLNSFKGEGYLVYPRIFTQRHLAYAKFNDTFQTQIDLMIPSQQGEVPDRPLILAPEESIHSINTVLISLLEVPTPLTQLRVGDTIGNTNNALVGASSPGSSLIYPGVFNQARVPGSPQAFPLHAAPTAFPSLQMKVFVTTSTGGATAGAKVSPTFKASASTGGVNSFQRLANRYSKDQNYLIVEIATHRFVQWDMNFAANLESDVGKVEDILTACFKGL
ncbi:MAG: hypothetical protein LH647_09975 [Leptolyngbyaceae cyanobacterium CAN_BIN12]|nr:hypothetical protein [Leptolyngbyaceae cyanobacterium CAN_BIN12]